MKQYFFTTLLGIATLFCLPFCSAQKTTNTSVEGETALARQQILDEVSEGNTETALHMLTDAGFEDIVLLQSRFDAAQKQFSLGLIDYEEWSRTQAQINYAILEVAPKAENSKSAAVILGDKITNLVETGQLEDALRLLSPAKPDDVALLMARMKTAEKYNKLGLVDAENLARIKAQISYAILELMK